MNENLSSYVRSLKIFECCCRTNWIWFSVSDCNPPCKIEGKKSHTSLSLILFSQPPSFFGKVHKSFSAVLLQELSFMTKKRLWMFVYGFRGGPHSVCFCTYVGNMYMYVFHLAYFPYPCYFHFIFSSSMIYFSDLNSRLLLVVYETTEKNMFKTLNTNLFFWGRVYI